MQFWIRSNAIIITKDLYVHFNLWPSHGSKGIRQWLINWCKSPMMIHTITPSEITISGRHSSWWAYQSKHNKVLNIVRQKNKKGHYKTLGTNMINNWIYPYIPASFTFLAHHKLHNGKAKMFKNKNNDDGKTQKMCYTFFKFFWWFLKRIIHIYLQIL